MSLGGGWACSPRWRECNKFCSLELLYPRIFAAAENELSSLALSGSEGRIIAVPGLVDRLLLGLDRCLLIVAYRRVVNGGISFPGECGGIVQRVCFRVLYYPNDVISPVFLFVRDTEKDLWQHLAEFCEVWVRGLAGSGLEFLKRFGKEGRISLGSMLYLTWWPSWTVGTDSGDDIH